MEPIHRRAYPDAERAAAQEAAISRVEQHAHDLLRDYKADPRSFDGRYVCADLVKDMFPEYSLSRESRGRFNNAVHNAAAVLAAEQFRIMLASKADDGRRRVVFLTGIPGAGKTSSVIAGGQLPSDVQCIFEGQLVRPETTIPKIQEAIDTGFQPVIIVVHTTPENALDNTIKRHNEYGRGASMAVMAQIMGGLPAGLRAVHEKFGDAVELKVFDFRDRLNPQNLTGWPALRILETEGSHEKIKERLTDRLAFWQATGSLSPECFAQAAGLSAPRPDAIIQAVPAARSMVADSDDQRAADGDGRDLLQANSGEAVVDDVRRPRAR